MTRYNNAYLLLDLENGGVIVKVYEDHEDNKMMCDVSKQICFSDCDDTFTIISIIYHGHEVEYGGWRPDMLMQYCFKVTGRLAWEQSFPQWDH